MKRILLYTLVSVMTLFTTTAQAADFEWGTATWNIDDQQTFNSIDELQLVGIKLTYTNPANFSMTFFNLIAVDYDLYVDDDTEPIKAEASSDPGQGLIVNFDYDFVEGHRYRIVTTESRLVFVNIATYSTDTLTTNTDSYTISFEVKGPELVKTIEVEGTMSLAIVNQETDRTFSALDVNEIKRFFRPELVLIRECEGVLLEGCTFENSPCWNIHLLWSKDIEVKNITVRNPSYSQNGDGIDIDACDGVHLQGCSFDVGDDAICLKSGKNEDGRRKGLESKNMLIEDCTVYAGQYATALSSALTSAFVSRARAAAAVSSMTSTSRTST